MVFPSLFTCTSLWPACCSGRKDWRKEEQLAHLTREYDALNVPLVFGTLLNYNTLTRKILRDGREGLTVAARSRSLISGLER